MNILCEHSALFSETWPTSGMTRGGRLYPLPTPGRRTVASECSSSPGLLPTPAAGNFNDGEDPESWEARRQRNLAKGINGNGQGTPLGMAVQLLKTPTAQLAVNGGSQHPDKRREGGHGPTLADQVEHHLLPTPTTTQRGPDANLEAREGSGPNLHNAVALLPTPSVALATGGQTSRSGDRTGEPLLPAIAKAITGGGALLPTPAARDWKSGQSNIMDRNARPLNEVVEMLLPTPTARTQDRTPEEAARRHLPGRAMGLLPTPRASDTGTPGRRASEGFRPPLSQVLLPTPMAADGERMSATMPRGNPTLIGALTGSPSAGGSTRPDGQLPGQLSLDGLESD